MKYLYFLLCFCVNCLFAQQIDYVNFKRAKAHIVFNVESKKSVSGLISYDFEVIKDIDSIVIDAVAFSDIKSVLDKTYENRIYNGKQLIVKHAFKKGATHNLIVSWETVPKKSMYFIDWEYDIGNKQIWTQGQGKYTSNWLPSIDDMNEKIEFDLSITFDTTYKVVANGKLINKETDTLNTTWHYDMQKPMSSYLVALAIGKYNKKVEYSKSGIPLEMYYYPKDSLKFEPTYRYTKQMFDFLEDEIGVPYPWQNYKQIPVKDFLYAGMENTSTTIFSDTFVIDSIAFVDKNYVNVNAHELAHQWFGDLVTETSGTHHWLQEGFATYYALLAEREVFGDDYYYRELYNYAQELLEQDKAGGSTSLLNPKSSSITFYKKGAWVLHMLRNEVGDDAFKKGVKNYLLKHQFKNVETNDFISEIERASGQDLSVFIKVWLESDKLNYDEMMNRIYSNEKVKKLISFDEIKKQIEVSEKTVYQVNIIRDLPVLKTYFSDVKLRDTTFFAGVDYNEEASIEFYKIAFKTKDIKVRQSIAQSLLKIPLELKTDYESLLTDKSYITIETALFNLWKNYPQDRKKYLNQTKRVVGFNDKNVRLLWLTLALVTDDFEVENKKQYFEELTDYTSTKYGFDIRQNAFQYLSQIQACGDICKENLKQATTHHNWRFSKFAKMLLKKG